MVKPRLRLTPTDILSHRICDAVSGPIIYLMACFSPWAFGTSQPWAIWTMNVLGFMLGFLLLVKLSIRHFKRYQPPRWHGTASAPGHPAVGRSAPVSR